MRVATHGVLAGAYRGNRASLKVTLTHSVDLDSDGERALCGQGNICGYPEGDEGDGPPTCKKCLRRDPRFQVSR